MISYLFKATQAIQRILIAAYLLLELRNILFLKSGRCLPGGYEVGIARDSLGITKLNIPDKPLSTAPRGVFHNQSLLHRVL